MTQVIRFAKSGARHAPTLPVDAITRTFGIFGVKDSGKTTTARVLVEGITKAGGNVVVLDPVGVWWGATRAGEGPGIPGIVIGGEHGDVPLEKTGGALVAELAVARSYPLVVVDLKLLRKGEAQTFMADFLEGVYFSNRLPLMLVFEEADRALPQNPRGMDPTLGRVMGAAEDIVKLGRSRGLGSMFISQRFATVTKNVTEQIEALVLHRQIGPNDRKAVKSWIESNGDPKATTTVMDSIARMEQGEAWLYSPGWLDLLERVRMRFPRTLDSSATPTNEQAQQQAAAPRAPVDLDELRSLMAETVERAAANDPKTLRARIEELEAEAGHDGGTYREIVERIVKEWGEPMPPRTNVADVVLEMKHRAIEPERVLVPDREALVEFRQALATAQTVLDELDVLGHDMERRHDEAKEGMGEVRGELEETLGRAMAAYESVAALPADGGKVAVLPVARSGAVDSADRPRRSSPAASSSDGELSAGTASLVGGLEKFSPLWLSKGQLAILLQRGKRSSTLTQQLAEAVSAGALESDRGSYRVPQTNGKRAPSPAQLRERFMGALPDGPRAIFAALVSYSPHPISRTSLFEAAGFSPTSSTPVGHLKLLIDNGLAEKVAGGAVQLGSAVT